MEEKEKRLATRRWKRRQKKVNSKHSCSICFKTFKTLPALRSHLGWHAREGIKSSKKYFETSHDRNQKKEKKARKKKSGDPVFLQRVHEYFKAKYCFKWYLSNLSRKKWIEFDSADRKTWYDRDSSVKNWVDLYQEDLEAAKEFYDADQFGKQQRPSNASSKEKTNAIYCCPICLQTVESPDCFHQCSALHKHRKIHNRDDYIALEKKQAEMKKQPEESKRQQALQQQQAQNYLTEYEPHWML